MTEPSVSEARKPHVAQRLSAVVYAFERSLAIAATVMMLAAYALMVLWQNATSGDNKFDLMLLKMTGVGPAVQYLDLAADRGELIVGLSTIEIEAAAATKAAVELKASVTAFWSPMLLAVLVISLVWIGIGSRRRSYAPGEAPPLPLWKRALWTAIITGALWGLIKAVGSGSALIYCLAVLGALLVAGFFDARRKGFSGDAIAALVGTLVGAGMLAWYFVEAAGKADGPLAYGWNLGLSGILLLYVGFIGASMATHDGRHIRVDAVRKGMKGPGFHLYNALSDLLALAFTAFLGWMAWKYLVRLETDGMRQEAAGLPQWVAAIPIVFAFAMMVLRFLMRATDSIISWRRRENAPEGAVELH